MKNPVLVIMAAGMGSRYGGLKQVDPVDSDGHVIMDFSIYDAIKAGFREIIFVIKKENREIFSRVIGSRVPKSVKVSYVYQELSDIPQGFQIPEGRMKPWGTAHAVLSCRNIIDGPFAVINADDYYGQKAFGLIYDYLTSHEDDGIYRFVMVGFILGNTLTDNGHVSRGVCTVDDEGSLLSIKERVYLVRTKGGAAYSEDDGKTFTPISADETVSMNLWGFSKGIMDELETGFLAFLEQKMPEDPLRAEYFLPSVVGGLIDEGRAQVKVLRSPDRWYGMTYKEDRAQVEAALEQLKD